jgi:phenylacetate-CoA ligase
MLSWYGALLRHALLPAGDALRGVPLGAAIAELERSQWRSRAELMDAADTKLRALVAHCHARMPAYRALLDDHGIAPAAIRGHRDLARLPLMTKTFLRAHFPDGLLDPALPRVDRYVHRTGGSTGEPMFFYLSRRARATDRAGFYRHLRWVGSERGELLFSVWGDMVVATQRARWARTLKSRLITRNVVLDAFEMTPATMDGFLALMRRRRPAVLRGYTTALVELARHADAHAIAVSGLRAVLTTAEQILPWQRELLERVFGAPVFDEYGCGEVQGVAYECAAHTGLHVALEHAIVEIVDEAGCPKPPGEVGRVALTGLDNLAMPFIRYVNGDEAALLPEPCPCGRGLPLMSPVQGRTADMIYGVNGQRAHGEFFTHLIHEIGWTDGLPITEFQVVQASRDTLRFDLAAGAMPPATEMERVTRRIQDYLGPMQVEFRHVAHVDRGRSGKRRFTLRLWNPEETAVAQ